MERVLPRHVQIIFEINQRFLTAVRQLWPGDEGRVQRLSIIAENGVRRVRMANLAVVGSHAVNGVSALHSRLVAESLMPDFSAFWPERFQNKTNGVTHRRWLLEINPELSDLVTSFVGPGWDRQPELLENFRAAAEDSSALGGFLLAKRHAKERLAAHASQMWGLRLNPDHMFDVQIKRIHQYKRQLLNALAILYDYLRITEDGWHPPVPRVSLFAGKAAPSYHAAKLIIRFINAIDAEIQGNSRASNWLQVAFLPDYRVSLAERIIPAADLSEQISTAGTEASGTGNMKLALNGALTIGTLDGANVEIREAAGPDNFFLFGLTTPEVQAMQADGTYRPDLVCASSGPARRIVEAIRGRSIGGCDPSLFQPILDSILSPADPYFHLADLDSYLDARSRAQRDYQDKPAWAARAIHNIAAMARFSSDRTIAEYARDIWGIRSLAG
jgi:glycogen phosphorylase